MKQEKIRILIVDDEPDLSMLMAFLLAEYGYSVDKVFDGQGALKKIEDGHFDYIVSDVQMPKNEWCRPLPPRCRALR